MDRRAFLESAATGVLTIATGAACAEQQPSDEVLATPALTKMFGERRVLQFGEWYREMVPAESDPDVLRAAIVKGEERRFHFPWSRGMTIDERVADDFANDRTVLVNGWLLSRTEARQCALRFAITS